MKNFIFVIALISFNVFSLCSNDRILVAKELVTLDDLYQDANAVYIKGNKFHSIGSKEDLIKKFPNIPVDHLYKDSVIVPGFIEHHVTSTASCNNNEF